jgi:hypothetical protein
MSLRKREIYLVPKQSVTAFKQKMIHNKEPMNNHFFSKFLYFTYQSLKQTILEIEEEQKHVSSWSNFIEFSYVTHKQKVDIMNNVSTNDIEQQMRNEFEDMRQEEINKVMAQYKINFVNIDLRQEISRKEMLYIHGNMIINKPNIPKEKKEKVKPVSELLFKSEHPLIQEFVKSRGLNLEQHEPKYIKILRNVIIDQQDRTSELSEQIESSITETSLQYEPTIVQTVQDIARKLLWKIYMLNAQFTEESGYYQGQARPPLTLKDRVMMKRITRRLKAILESPNVSDERK